jgi:Uma2 family endonuclease
VGAGLRAPAVLGSKAVAQIAPQPDPTIYPVSDDMGENTLETLIRVVLLPLLQRYLAERGTPMFVGSSQFIYWQQFNSARSLAPDIYTIPALPPDAEPTCIKTWELGPGGVPPFALEVVSGDKGKDYVLAPQRYDELGTRELVIYDPEFEHRRDGRRFQVFRRLKGRGLTQVEATNDERVRSRVLGCSLVEVPEGSSVRLRLGVGKGGDELFPTALEAQRAATEAERAAKEAERAAKEVERAARQQSETRVAELEARLRALEGKRGPAR